MRMVGLSQLDVEAGDVSYWQMTQATLDTALVTPVDEGDLTYNQQSQLDAEWKSRWYAVRFDIAGQVDSAAFGAALTDFVTRHSTLCTGFRRHGERYRRFTMPRDSVAMERVDIGVKSSRTEIVDCLRDLFERTIDSLRWPAYVFATVAGESATTVFLAFDHIHVDLSSFALAVFEVQELYRARMACVEPDLGPPEVATAAVPDPGSRAWPHLDGVVQVWQEFLARCGGAVPGFPLDVGAEPDVHVPLLAEELVLVDEAVAARFEDCCRAAGGSFFSGLLAAAAVAANRTAGNGEYRAIAAFHNREAASTGSFGWYAAGAPIAIPITAGAGFAAVVGTAHEAARRARAHAAVPFDLVEAKLPSSVHMDHASWFSYVDFRRFPGAEFHDPWKAAIVCHDRVGSQADVWVNRSRERTYVHVRYPHNDVAGKNVMVFVEAMRSIIGDIASGVCGG